MTNAHVQFIHTRRHIWMQLQFADRPWETYRYTRRQLTDAVEAWRMIGLYKLAWLLQQEGVRWDERH